ncbi:MAG: hypothetical protein U0353_10970 [Sandaracinus sp.]
MLYTYDDDGNRTTRTTSAGVEQYHYGVGWRLTSIERASTTTQAWEWPITQLVWDQNALLKVVSLTG